MKQPMQFLDVIASLVWFASLITISLVTNNEPTQFILAYIIPVVVTTWKRNLQWGFLIAAVGAFSAAASGAVMGNTNADISLAEEGLFFFAQLSAIAIGIVLGKRAHPMRGKFIKK